ncbi:hypothetical protein CDAR_611951 [Caerostris darwini]|uniref:Uncharacterized protein n=1 Tax=Caerostris darwini TaxID=1538125 RepID=A0AAV4MWT3_9ARAC|nr:hypothetical protein CDAR_611951 [Caerostris darwini]
MAVCSASIEESLFVEQWRWPPYAEHLLLSFPRFFALSPLVKGAQGLSISEMPGVSLPPMWGRKGEGRIGWKEVLSIPQCQAQGDGQEIGGHLKTGRVVERRRNAKLRPF